MLFAQRSDKIKRLSFPSSKILKLNRATFYRRLGRYADTTGLLTSARWNDDTGILIASHYLLSVLPLVAAYQYRAERDIRIRELETDVREISLCELRHCRAEIFAI